MKVRLFISLMVSLVLLAGNLSGAGAQTAAQPPFHPQGGCLSGRRSRRSRAQVNSSVRRLAMYKWTGRRRA